MKIDWYTKAILAVIAVSLTVLATRPFLIPPPSYAARQTQYKVSRITPLLDSLERQLNNLGNEGWEVASMVPSGDLYLFILKR